MDIRTLIQPHVHDLELYVPPDWEALAARAGIRPGQLVRLDTNENPYPTSLRVAQALARFDDYGYYPDYGPLIEALARYAGVNRDNTFIGNGGDEIIDMVVRLFVAPGDGIIICPPAFGMYAVSGQAHLGTVLRVPRRDDFSLDVEGIEALVDNQNAAVRPKLLFVTSPGNPDGGQIPLETIRRLLKLPLAVVVDEAYVEFGGESAVPLLEFHPNLIVLRTLSKWASMAGLRLGYGLASAEIVRAVEHLRLPYNVSVAAVVAAMATFEDLDAVQETITRTIVEREQLRASLASLPGVQPQPSLGNFVLCRLEGCTGQELADALAAQGILVRSFSDPSLANVVRITVGRPEQNRALLAALSHILLGTEALELPVQEPALTPRGGAAHRQTGETDISVALHLDGTGQHKIDTGIGFLDHMLAQLAAHGLFDLNVRARGDLYIDEHHTVEDVAISLGQALDQALGSRRGLVRMGEAYAPLDEALAQVIVDLSGRPYAVIEAEFAAHRIGTVNTDLIIHFLETLATHARMSLHARVLYGRNDHHKAEALFKALGRALDAATRIDPRREGVPSTKGVL